ncbi:MAG: hypothetical protein RR390_09800 [Hafnia sp.]
MASGVSLAVPATPQSPGRCRYLAPAISLPERKQDALWQQVIGGGVPAITDAGMSYTTPRRDHRRPVVCL